MLTRSIATLACLAGAPAQFDTPAGPVAARMKPLDQVEPRTAVSAVNTPGGSDSILRIAAPGSYCLTADITGQPGQTGLGIAASDVTLDLSGFITSTGTINTTSPWANFQF